MDQKPMQMRRNMSRRLGALIGIAGFFGVLLFQNCDGGFHYDPTTGALSSASLNGVGSDQFRLTTYNPAGLVVPEGQSLDGGADYKVVASGISISTATILWQLTTNTGNCILKAGTGPETRYVNCVRSGTVSIQSSAIWPDGSTTVLASQRTTSELVLDLCGPSSAARPVFRIANGTGTNAWNSTASPVVVYVGQVLRVCNDDSIAHQLRTDGTPCATQPASMVKGQFYDCTISTITGRNAMTGVYNGMYDQIAGVNAAFYVRPYDGQALYADTTKTSTGTACNTCHNAFATSSKRGSSFTSIKNAITNNAGGMNVYAGRITDDEIRAIAFSLNQ